MPFGLIDFELTWIYLNFYSLRKPSFIYSTFALVLSSIIRIYEKNNPDFTYHIFIEQLF